MSSGVNFATTQVSGNPDASSGFSGLPFPTPLASAWDGVTYFSGQPSGSNAEYIPVFGNGTLHPVGFTFDELFRFVWNIKYCDITSVWNGVAEPDGGGGLSPLIFTAEYSYGSSSSWFKNDPSPVETSFASARSNDEFSILSNYGTSAGSLSASVFSPDLPLSYLPGSYTFSPDPFDPNISAFFSVNWPDVTSRCGFNNYVAFTPLNRVLRSIDNLYYPEMQADLYQSSDNANIKTARGTCTTYKEEPTASSPMELCGTFEIVGIGSVDLFFKADFAYLDPIPSCSITLDPTSAYLWPYV